MSPWPFADPKETVVLIDPGILAQGDWIFYVARNHDRTWRVGGPDHLSLADGEFSRTRLDSVVSIDSSLLDLADLPCGWDAWRQSRCDPWERKRQPIGQMYYIQFEGTPRSSTPEFDQIAGAIISCWIVSSSVEKATLVARACIEESGWIINEPDEAYQIEPQQFRENSQVWQYIRQAQVDGDAYVYDMYSLDDDA